MKTATQIITCAAALLIGVICTIPQADARRAGGIRARPHISATHIRRPGRWVNGVWVVGGVAASVAAGTASNCSYYYQRWENTGRKYWHDRYYELCRNWE